jgi:putative hydrolase of the HAD superfamily
LNQVTKIHLRNARFERTLNHFSISDNALVEQLSDGYVELSPKQKVLHENAVQTLEELKNDGYEMHIITNGFKEVQYTKLKVSGLRSFFKEVICSEEIGKNKPSPQIFQYALSKARAKPIESVMIGDDLEADIIGALNAGMHAIHFLPDSEKLGNVNDFCTVTNLNQLPEVLLNVLKTTY